MTSKQSASLRGRHKRPVPASRLELWAIDHDAVASGAVANGYLAHFLSPLVVEDAQLQNAQQPGAIFARVTRAAPSDAAYIISLCSRTDIIDHCAIDAQTARQIFPYVNDWQDERLRVPGAQPHIFTRS
jgi:hypothetical protein